MRKILRRAIEDAFSDKLMASFKKHFALEIETEWQLLSMQRVSRRVDGKRFTKAQAAFLAGYEGGYGDACDQVGS